MLSPTKNDFTGDTQRKLLKMNYQINIAYLQL